MLYPRRDHLIRQFARIGLKAYQLDTHELVALFYRIYNADAGDSEQAINFASEEKPLPAVPEVELTAPLANTPQITTAPAAVVTAVVPPAALIQPPSAIATPAGRSVLPTMPTTPAKPF